MLDSEAFVELVLAKQGRVMVLVSELARLGRSLKTPADSSPPPQSVKANRAERRPPSAALRSPALDLLVIAALLAAALPYRLTNIDSSAAKSDEGIRLLQYFLMSEGFRPVRDIFASQGPLSLDATYPLFVLSGGTIAAARLAVVAYALAELAACYLLTCQLAGRLAGLIAGLLLVLSPVYLENSRTALVEIPALLPATLAILCVVRFADGCGLPWLIASAVLLALAILIKPIVLAAGVPILVALLLRPTACLRTLLFYSAAVAAFVGLVVLLVGPGQLYEQVVRYRMGSAQAEGYSLNRSLGTLAAELRAESHAWAGLALVAAPLALLAGPRRALLVLAWPAATLALLLGYSPLMPKHAVVLVPPVAVLIGFAIGCVLLDLRLLLMERVGYAHVRLSQSPSLVSGAHAPDTLSCPRRIGAIAALLLIIWYATATPAILARGHKVANGGLAADARAHALGSMVANLSAVSAPTDYLVVDEPYLAYLSKRRVPPSLADPTEYRLRSGTLSGTEIIEAATAYDVKVMLLWSDGLRGTKKFRDWVDANYRPVKIYERGNRKDRALYLRNDADFPTARATLRAARSMVLAADFAGQLRLAAAHLDRTVVRPGGTLPVSLEWEALAALAGDYHVVAILHGPDGQPTAQLQRALGGGGVRTAFWQPGQWVIRTFALRIPTRSPPGDYLLSLAVHDSESHQLLPVTLKANSPADEVPIARITVRRSSSRPRRRTCCRLTSALP